MNKIKVVGYAKKEFLNDGIEYRDFSPSLVGNQFATNDGSPIFTSGNFSVTTNLDSKINKNFVTNDFTNFICLDSLNLDPTLDNVINKYSKNAKLNLDYDDVLTYAFFGSLREYIRVSLENIIIMWPASIFVLVVDPTNPSNVGDTVTNYEFNPLTNLATFDIKIERIQNPFEINYLCGVYGEFTLTNFIGASGLEGSSIKVTTQGNPFPNFSSEVLEFHIKPNELKLEEFFFNLNEFEAKLLNRLTIPTYSSNFKVYSETENGTTVESNRKLTWPVTDGYNIDFNSIDYSGFVSKLLELADINDNSRSNLIVRFLVSSSISEFDSIPDIDGTYSNSNGQKMTSTLKIYGREFDEIKKYSDGIAFANVVTYDKKNNTPDIVLKNLARVLGWELTTSISEVDVVGNFLSLNNNYYDGYSRGLSDAETELELWRRIILNTPWLWKSKGTRKAIEFLFKFIGAPDGLVTFNEHIYVANDPVDIDVVENMMEYFNGTPNISGLNVDSNGYPFVLPNTPEMYFQKAGLWYRQTGGANPDIDILSGNNPHIGPYDGGQAYINQFTQCLIPNFSGGTSEEVESTEIINLFSNYDNGTFDECCDSNVFVDIITKQDFDGILQTNKNKFLDNYPVIESGCTITNSWTLIASLTGETFYESNFFSGSTAPMEIDYVNEIYNLSGTTELNQISFDYDSINGVLRMIEPNGCDGKLLGEFFKLELCVSTDYDCLDEGVVDLIRFLVALNPIDACGGAMAQSLETILYHNGTSILPQIGDTIYLDALGLNIFVTPLSSPRDFYLGGSITDINNFLRTDVNGVRVEIICPTIECAVYTGLQTIGSDANSVIPTQIFWINGVSEIRTTTLKFSLINVVKTSISDNVIVTMNENFAFPTQIFEEIPFEVTLDIIPNNGVFSNYDYDSMFTATATNGVVSFTVRMDVINIENECIINSTYQEYNALLQ